jgi:invasion protein IalB
MLGKKGTMLAWSACTALLIAVTPAAAQSQAPGASSAKDKDPNRIICEKIEEIGSRLASKRVCMTAAQWKEQQRLERENLEDVQRRKAEPAGH